MEKILIQEFTEDKAGEVKQLVINVHEEFGFSYDKILDYDLKEIKNVYIQSGGGFWIALHQGDVVGCIAIKETERNGEKIAELKRMYLYPIFRSKGIGQKLLDVAIQYAKSKGYKNIILDTTQKQLKAIKLYEKNGFSLVKQVDSTLFYTKQL